MDTKQTYAVVLFRLDGQDRILLQSESFDECFQVWEVLHKEWTSAVSDKRPFILKKPTVTAFDPALIKEISVNVMPSVMKESDNPYVKKMQSGGLGGMFSGNVLDQGYT